jgi:hypothetical protein
MDTTFANVLTGWTAIAAGVLSGALIGLRFHDQEWLGGYGSFRRRMLRLGHIACFGLGFLNLMFATTERNFPLASPWQSIASIAFIAGAATMPVACFLTAWSERFRRLFPIPVSVVTTAVCCVIGGLLP